MSRHRILAMVLAGGQGGRMEVLTRERAKPSLPFAGVYQLIDFPLSNLHHSGLDDVWLSVQYQPGSLDDVVANGRPWDMDRTRGGFRVLVPQEGIGADEDGFAQGNADVLWRVRDQIRAADPEQLIVLSADHVYRLDLDDVLATHEDKGAECTLVTTAIPRAEASNHMTVTSNRLRRVTGTAYKPERPDTDIVGTEVFVYHPQTLIEVLETLHHELSDDTEHGQTGLGDFGEHLVPRLVERGRCFEHRMDGYWRDVGRPEAYFAAHRDLLEDTAGAADLLGDPAWPILTRSPQGPPARVHTGAAVHDSLLGPACDVRGTVQRSVLGPGVQVAEGAEVTDSILYAGTRVERDARVAWSILDTDVVVEAGARVGDSPAGDLPTSEELVLVGRDSRIGAGVRLRGGARLDPGTIA